MATWLITGCSSGLGRALAAAVLAAGEQAVVTARDPRTVEDLVAAHPDTALAAALDVTDRDAVRDVVRRAKERFGGVDVLVNNAGYGYRSAVEEGDDEPVRTLFATHLFGPLDLMKAVLPGMRARRSGTIVNVSSVGARIMQPGSGYYASVKSALEGLSGALRAEVEPLGIRVVVVEPGSFRTDFAGRSLTQSAHPIDDYADTAGPRRKDNDRVDGTQPGDPAKAAEAILTAVRAPEPPAFLLLGSDALRYHRLAVDAELAQVERWRDLSASTDLAR